MLRIQQSYVAFLHNHMYVVVARDGAVIDCEYGKLPLTIREEYRHLAGKL